jgi:hypothetical protein
VNSRPAQPVITSKPNRAASLNSLPLTHDDDLTLSDVRGG